MVFNAHLALSKYNNFLEMNKKEFVLPVLLDIIFFLIIVRCVINYVQLVMAVQSIHVHPVILPFIITHNHCKLVQLLVDKDIINLKIVLVQPVILRVTLVLLV
jgi:hypothetical protein